MWLSLFIFISEHEDGKHCIPPHQHLSTLIYQVLNATAAHPNIVHLQLSGIK